MGVYLSNLNYSFFGAPESDPVKEKSAGADLNEKTHEKLVENTPLDQDKVDLTPRQIKESNLKQKELTDREKQDLAKLKAADREVKAHEQAHRSVAGQYARGGINYRYATGPDGKRYAIGGDVDIDASKVSGDPEATAQKMAQVKRAALAPADPSPQDRKVAALATRMEAAARAAADKQKLEKLRTQTNENKQNEEETADKARNSGTMNLGVSPYEAVNEFKKGVRPELVSNLFDLFT